MFGWRRKNEGFVWHDYVRTTVLARRADRKKKIEDIKAAAVAGVKEAGRQGAAASAAGARYAARNAWNGLRHGALRLWDWSLVAWDALSVRAVATWLWLLDRIVPLLVVAGIETARGWSQVLDLVRLPTVTLACALIGAIAAVSASVGVFNGGLDGQTTVAAMVAGLALLLLAAAYVPAVGIARRLGLDRLRLPAMTGAQANTAGRVLQIAGTLALAVGLTVWLGPAFMAGLEPAATTVPVGAGLSPSGSAVEGKATVVAADRLDVAGTALRLYGIEAPEASQACPGTRSCAAAAKAQLQRLVQGKRIACTLSGRADKGSLASATCAVAGVDVAAQLVRGGYVFSETGLFATYATVEREARLAKLGVWRGDGLRPPEYRAKVWESAKAEAPNGCPIKGVVSGDGKTYLMPWTAGYDRAKVRATRGERWLCSEADAREQGFKLAEGR